MRKAERAPLAWVSLGLLGMLMVTNITLWALEQTGGPLIGVTGYGGLLILALRGRQTNYRAAMVGGLLGLVVHVVEVVARGWSAHTGLMALNLVLPAVLVPMCWLAGQQCPQDDVE
jgi:hypothetical protein